MAKAGSETKAILKLLLKLSEERINKEIRKTVDEQNKAGEFTDTHDTYVFCKGKAEGLRYAISCFSEVISDIQL
jgi:hypothetical protein